MITAMKKVEILLYHQEREAFLHALAEQGVVHISEKVTETSSTQGSLAQEILITSRALNLIKHQVVGAAPLSISPSQWVARVLAIVQNLDKIKNEKSILSKEAAPLQIWGNFSPALLQRLAQQNIVFNLCEIPRKERWKLDSFTYEIVQEVAGKIYAVVITIPGDPPLSWDTLPLPNHSLAELLERQQKLQQEEAVLEQELNSLAAGQSMVVQYLKSLEEELDLENARQSMRPVTADSLLYLQGWIPASKSAILQQTLAPFACWYQLVAPTPQDQVPILLKNRPLPKMFEPITKIFALPDYFELDPTVFIAPFYALFFGMCLSDTGYGVLLILLAILGAIKLPALRPIMYLAMILGSSTILCGFLLNSFFGQTIFNSTQGTVAILSEVQFQGHSVYPAMAFSIYLGLLQILVGMALRAVNGVRNGTWIDGIYPVGTMLLTLAVTGSLIQINLLEMTSFFEIISNGKILTATLMHWPLWQPVLTSLVTVGLILIFFFNNPDKKLAIRLPLGLWQLYQFSTAIIGDGLSYIRLFALGLAGGLLGNSFNSIAFGLMSADQPKWMVIFTILILLVGHSINFCLACLGSFVHPLRLTFVEFYNNLGFKGGGIGYRPLLKSNTNTTTTTIIKGA